MQRKPSHGLVKTKAYRDPAMGARERLDQGFNDFEKKNWDKTVPPEYFNFKTVQGSENQIMETTFTCHRQDAF